MELFVVTVVGSAVIAGLVAFIASICFREARKPDSNGPQPDSWEAVYETPRRRGSGISRWRPWQIGGVVVAVVLGASGLVYVAFYVLAFALLLLNPDSWWSYK